MKEQEASVFEDQIKAVFPKDLSKKKNRWHKSAQKLDNSTFELPPLKRVQVSSHNNHFLRYLVSTILWYSLKY